MYIHSPQNARQMRSYSRTLRVAQLPPVANKFTVQLVDIVDGWIAPGSAKANSFEARTTMNGAMYPFVPVSNYCKVFVFRIFTVVPYFWRKPRPSTHQGGGEIQPVHCFPPRRLLFVLRLRFPSYSRRARRLMVMRSGGHMMNVLRCSCCCNPTMAGGPPFLRPLATATGSALGLSYPWHHSYAPICRSPMHAPALPQLWRPTWSRCTDQEAP